MESTFEFVRAILRHLGLAPVLITVAMTSTAAEGDRQWPSIVEAHLTKRGNVAITRTDGSKVLLTRQGHCVDVLVANDRRTVAWTRSTERASVVFIYRDGVVKRIKGDPFVRGIWFLEGGRKIGIDSGGAHFAGLEVLYDVATLRELDRSSQLIPTSERPSWSYTSDVYAGDGP